MLQFPPQHNQCPPKASETSIRVAAMLHPQKKKRRPKIVCFFNLHHQHQQPSFLKGPPWPETPGPSTQSSKARGAASTTSYLATKPLFFNGFNQQKTVGNNLDCNWPKHGSVDGFFQQIWNETWPCFYVFFGGLQGSCNIAEHFVGIECTKMTRSWRSGKSWPSCYTILVAVKLQTTIYSRFLVSIPKSPANKIAQMPKMHHKTHHKFWEYISHENQPEIADSRANGPGHVP